MLVRDILRVKGTALFTVGPETLLSECVTVMADLDIGSLVVMDQGRLAGMLSFREVLRVLAQRQREQRIGPTPTMSLIKASEVMEPKPRIASPDMDVNDLRSAVTVVSLLVFIGIFAWAWSRRNRDRFDEAARLPFQDE